MSMSSFVGLICFLLLALVQAAPDGRILGGSTAKEGQFPYQVSLKRKGKHSCGGCIISKNFILTAAHCVVEPNTTVMLPASLLTVHAGSTDTEKGGVQIPVAQIIKHLGYIAEETFSAFVKRDDLALLKLAKPLTFSETIQPIALYSGITLEGTPVTVSGWGRLWKNGIAPTQLQWIVLKSNSEESCYSAKKLLCLGHPKTKGVCVGDSGGPAVAYNRLVGITSFGTCGSTRPDAFVKIANYIDWIKNHSDV